MEGEFHASGSYQYGGSSGSSNRKQPPQNDSDMRLTSVVPEVGVEEENSAAALQFCSTMNSSTSSRGAVVSGITPRRRKSRRTNSLGASVYNMIALAILCCTALNLFQFVEAALDPMNPCAHEDAYNVGEVTEMADGSSVYTELPANYTHRYFYSNYNVTVFNQEDAHRNLIINLEPCKGVVYLFVRKTRRCFPNPYSCVMPGEVAQPSNCEWTHFMSVIDGTRDGAPTFFELPLTSTKYYISVYAREKSFYTLSMLSDIGAYPRPGNRGELSAMQLAELQVQLTWHTATYFPEGISETNNYHIYSAMLLDSDKRTNSAIFLSKNKIMNTVCGLRNNTDRAFGAPIPASRCYDGKCNATIDGVIVGKRYVFNVIAESHRGFNMSYAGLILRTDWQVVRKAASDNTLQVVGAVTGSVFAVVIILYLWMIQLYGK